MRRDWIVAHCTYSMLLQIIVQSISVAESSRSIFALYDYREKVIYILLIRQEIRK